MGVNSGLGRIVLDGLSVKGNILSDKTISTSVILMNMSLDDTRPGKQKAVNRLIERKDVTLESGIPKSMLDCTLRMKNNDIFGK